MAKRRIALTRFVSVMSATVLMSASAQATPFQDHPMARAIRANDVAEVQALLLQKVDPNSLLSFATTPLALAVETQNPDLVAPLLAAGADANRADADGFTPLMLACERGNPMIATQLLDAGTSTRAALPDGTSVLSICARFGSVETVARLLKGGAKPDAVDRRGQTALMWAASAGRAESVTLLLSAGASVNRVSKSGFTPLFFAIKSGSVAAVQALLKGGADASYRGPENTSAIQLALYQKHPAVAALFVPLGADLVERDREGRQVLHVASETGDVALISALLAKGADPNGQTGPSRISWVTEANFGVPPPPVPPTPPVLIAAANGHVEAMAALVAAGADPKFIAANGTNIVLAASQSRNPAALEHALALAPGVDVTDSNGMTPLHLVLSSGPHPALATMIRLLKAKGARTDIKNRWGKTAAEMAETGLTSVKLVYQEVYSPQESATEGQDSSNSVVKSDGWRQSPIEQTTRLAAGPIQEQKDEHGA